MCAVVLVMPAWASAGTRERSEPAFAGPAQERLRAEPGVEVPELRSRTSRTFRTPEGELVARVWGSAVNFKDDAGRWQRIDNRLEREGGGFANRAGELEVDLPSSLGAGSVRAASDRGQVSFGLVGATDAAARVQGAKATYPGALPGVDVAYESGGEQLKETLTLREGAQSRFRFDLGVSEGLELDRERGGGYTVRDGGGRAVFSLAAPFVYDHEGELGPEGTVAVSLDGGRLVLEVDEEWLRPALERGPVVLDPVVALPQAVQDTAIESSPGWDTVDQSGDQYLRVGGSSSYDTRALLKFDVDSVLPHGADVRRASMYLYSEFDISGSGKTFGAYEAGTAWTNQATWQTRNGSTPWASGGGDPTGAAESTVPVTSPYRTVTFGMTKLARRWATGTENHGVVVKAEDNQSAPENYHGFASSESPNVSRRPAIDIAYRMRVGARGDHEYVDQSLTDRESLSVDLGSGNLLLSSNDLKIAGTGLDLQVQRTYQSRQSEQVYAAGSKSGFSFDQWIDRHADDGTIAVNDAGGANFRLSPVAGQPDRYRGEGLQATLTRNGDGSFDLVYDGSDRRLRYPAFPSSGGSSPLAWEQDRNGNRLTYARSAGQTTITDTQGRTTTVTYSPYGPATKVRDHTGRETSYGLNSNGAIISATAPTGAQTTYGYSADGRSNLTQINTPGGGQATLAYDGQDRVTSLSRKRSSASTAVDTWAFSYSTQITAPCAAPETKVQTTLTDPRGKQTVYCVDANQRVSKSRDAKGRVRDKAFNALGYVTEIKSPGNNASGLGLNTSFTYNGDNAITKITRGSGSNESLSSSFSYDTSRKYQPQTSTSPQGNSTTFGYDGQGNTTSTRQGASGGPEVRMTYDAKGNVATSTDPNGNVTRYEYDGAGNPTKITPPAPLGATTITTDALSRIRTVTDGKGQTKTFTYDALDRVTKVDYPNSTSTTFAYDGAGNPTSRGDAPSAGLWGITTYAYDLRNRETRVVQPDHHWTEYAYDPTGNLTSFKDMGGTVLYEYDDVNQLSSLKENADTPAATFVSDADGNRETTTLPNGVVVDTPYDQAGRLRSITAKKGSTVLQDRTFDYTRGSQQTSLIQRVTDAVTGTTTAYTYDELDRLTDAVGTGGSQASAYSYTLDPAGNRLRESRRDPGQGSATLTNWTYDAANQPATRNGAAAGYQFDPNGNETSNGAGRTQSYNAKAQTTAVASGGTSTPLTHLGTGQEDLGQIGGQRLVQDALGLGYKPAASGSWTHYTRTPQGDYIGERKSQKSYFLTDERGSIVGLTDTQGAKTADYRYDPYGRSLGTPHGTLGYVSGEQAPGGLTHFGARYYDPQVGRWTQTDPVNRADDPNGGAYVYADADPINLTDTAGDCPPCKLRPILQRGWERFKSTPVGRTRFKVGAHNHPGGPHAYPHLQLNYWRAGRKGSHKVFRTPKMPWMD